MNTGLQTVGTPALNPRSSLVEEQLDWKKEEAGILRWQ